MTRTTGPWRGGGSDNRGWKYGGGGVRMVNRGSWEALDGLVLDLEPGRIPSSRLQPFPVQD